MELREERLFVPKVDLYTGATTKEEVIVYRVSQLMNLVLNQAMKVGSIIFDPKTNVYLVDRENGEKVGMHNDGYYNPELDACFVYINSRTKRRNCLHELKEAEFEKHGAINKTSGIGLISRLERIIYGKFSRKQKLQYKSIKAKLTPRILKRDIGIDHAKAYEKTIKYTGKQLDISTPALNQWSSPTPILDDWIGDDFVIDPSDLFKMAEGYSEIDAISMYLAEFSAELGISSIRHGLIHSAITDYGYKEKLPRLGVDFEKLNEEGKEWYLDEHLSLEQLKWVYHLQRKICQETSPFVANTFALCYYSERDMIRTLNDKTLLQRLKHEGDAEKIKEAWESEIGGDFKKLKALVDGLKVLTSNLGFQKEIENYQKYLPG